MKNELSGSKLSRKFNKRIFQSDRESVIIHAIIDSTLAKIHRRVCVCMRLYTTGVFVCWWETEKNKARIIHRHAAHFSLYIATVHSPENEGTKTHLNSVLISLIVAFDNNVWSLLLCYRGKLFLNYRGWSCADEELFRTLHFFKQLDRLEFYFEGIYFLFLMWPFVFDKNRIDP